MDVEKHGVLPKNITSYRHAGLCTNCVVNYGNSRTLISITCAKSLPRHQHARHPTKLLGTCWVGRAMEYPTAGQRRVGWPEARRLAKGASDGQRRVGLARGASEITSAWGWKGLEDHPSSTANVRHLATLGTILHPTEGLLVRVPRATPAGPSVWVSSRHWDDTISGELQVG